MTIRCSLVGALCALTLLAGPLSAKGGHDVWTVVFQVVSIVDDADPVPQGITDGADPVLVSIIDLPDPISSKITDGADPVPQGITDGADPILSVTSVVDEPDPFGAKITDGIDPIPQVVVKTIIEGPDPIPQFGIGVFSITDGADPIPTVKASIIEDADPVGRVLTLTMVIEGSDPFPPDATHGAVLVVEGTAPLGMVLGVITDGVDPIPQ
jgi:hypothetical protein